MEQARPVQQVGPVTQVRPMRQVRPMAARDWPAVRTIFVEGIATGLATFETEPPSWPEWDRAHTPDHRLVAHHEGEVLGWAACSPMSSRCVYAGVLELSLYVAHAARGQGVGHALLRQLIASTEADGVWTLQAGIFPTNAASLALHERHGFRRIGVRERVGRLGDQWLDVVLVERRSTVAGT